MKMILFLPQSGGAQGCGDREVVKGHRKTSSSPRSEEADALWPFSHDLSVPRPEELKR
jgi:hypothetical protein